jgi:hypothetical protein
VRKRKEEVCNRFYEFHQFFTRNIVQECSISCGLIKIKSMPFFNAYIVSMDDKLRKLSATKICTFIMIMYAAKML